MMNKCHLPNSNCANPLLRVHLVIEDLELRKLSTFSIDRAKMSLIGPTIAVNISIPEIYANGHYNISGVLGDTYPLHGAGSFETNIYNFRVYVNTVLGYARGMYMKRFDLDFSLRAVKIHLENFMGGEEIGQIMSKVSLLHRDNVIVINSVFKTCHLYNIFP